MQSYGKKIIEEIIDWAVPVACAGALLLWNDIPMEIKHFWPVICTFIVGLYSLVVAIQNRREVKRLRRIHEKADAKEEQHRIIEDSIIKAFRAMLDDDMGNLYASCIAKGYTTEDERRRYDRLQKAYESVGGNGEAKRRKNRFVAIPDEEEWKAVRLHNTEQKG